MKNCYVIIQKRYPSSIFFFAHIRTLSVAVRTQIEILREKIAYNV